MCKGEFLLILIQTSGEENIVCHKSLTVMKIECYKDACHTASTKLMKLQTFVFRPFMLSQGDVFYYIFHGH